MKEKLEVQVDYLDKNPSVGIVYSYVHKVDSAMNFISIVPKKPAENFMDLISACAITTNSALVRKQCLDEAGDFRSDLKIGDDYEMWLRIAHVYPIKFLPEVVGLYRQHAASFTSNSRRLYLSALTVYDKVRHTMALNQEERKAVRIARAMVHYRMASESIDGGKYYQAFFDYIRSLVCDPLIGVSVTWSRSPNIIYRLIKPYLGVGYCFFRFMLDLIHAMFGASLIEKKEGV